MIKFILVAALIIFHGVKGFPGGSDSKESACSVGNLGLIPWTVAHQAPLSLGVL